MRDTAAHNSNLHMPLQRNAMMKDVRRSRAATDLLYKHRPFAVHACLSATDSVQQSPNAPSPITQYVYPAIV